MRELAAFEQFVDALVTLFVQDANLIFQVASQTLLFALLNRQRALIFLLTFAGKDLHVDYGAVDSRRGN